MPLYARTKRTKRSGGGKRRMRGKRGALGVKAVKDIARQVAREGREKKRVAFQFFNYALSPYGIGNQNGSINSLTRLPLTPQNYTNTPATLLQIPQGTGSDDRIGNKIRMISGKLRIMINPTAQDSTFNVNPIPYIVTVFVGYDKTQAHGIPLSNFPDFYMVGDLAVPPQGNLLDTFRKVNTSRYVICYKRTVKIGYSEAAGFGQNAAAQYFANNDFSFSKKITIDFTKRMLKDVKFTDSSDLVPCGRQLWAWFMIVAADGTVTTNARAVEIHCENELYYTDA